MGFPWYLKPNLFLHADMLDQLDELNSSASNSHADDLRQDKEIERLKTRVTELENQLLALEKILADQGLLPPAPEPSEMKEPPKRPPDAPAVFPARTEEVIACPRCGRRQKGNRDSCYACGLRFQYENECSQEVSP